MYFFFWQSFLFRRSECDQISQYCANQNVSKLEEWKKSLCTNCELKNAQKEELYDVCEAAADSLGYRDPKENLARLFSFKIA